MYLSSALVASFLALTAHAFLVPLEVADKVDEMKAELTSFLASKPLTVDLDCPGCPFFDLETSEQPESDVPNKIHLEISLDSVGELTINKHRILDTSVLAAPQSRVSDSYLTLPLPLSFAYERLDPVPAPEDPSQTLQPYRFTILALNGHPVQVDTVDVNVVSGPESSAIASVVLVPFASTPGATECQDASRWSMCRIRAIFVARIASFIEGARSSASQTKEWFGGSKGKKGCGRKFGPPGKFGHGKFGHGKFGSKPGEAPPGHRFHHGHGGHGHHPWGNHHGAHRLGHMLHQTLRFFVIPALLGVIGGLIASAVGMLVGQFICYMWIRFYRQGGRRAQPDIRVVELTVDEDEKDALLLVDGEHPPAYQDEEVDDKN